MRRERRGARKPGKLRFRADSPNQLGLTDITESSIPADKVCLSSVIDCFDGMCVAWAQSTSPNAELASAMLGVAASKPHESERPVGHGDRGCRYRRSG
ncbi:DDE-type integrase/transposase/recombinase [Adlercreutzia muris]|uniref:DDE-type integrase/transposase/recombinase n=1 Tax=Adlercreutzia muris TaxID=1796610 RepID=UPI003513B61F